MALVKKYNPISKENLLDEVEAVDCAPGVADAKHTHTQTIPAKTWTVNHGRGKRVAVSITDSYGNAITGDITYVDDNTIEITFHYLYSGFAYCN